MVSALCERRILRSLLSLNILQYTDSQGQPRHVRRSCKLACRFQRRVQLLICLISTLLMQNECDCSANDNDWLWGWVDKDCGPAIFDWWRVDLVAVSRAFRLLKQCELIHLMNFTRLTTLQLKSHHTCRDARLHSSTTDRPQLQSHQGLRQPQPRGLEQSHLVARQHRRLPPMGALNSP